MSYILDALKSSDQDRKKRDVPNLQSHPEPLLPTAPVPFESNRKDILLWLPLLLLVALLVWMLSKSTIIDTGEPSTPVAVADPVIDPPVDVAPMVEAEDPQQEQLSPDEVYLDELKDVQLDFAPVADVELPVSQAPETQASVSTPAVADQPVIEAAPPGELPQTESGVNIPTASSESDSASDRYQGIPHQGQLAFDLQRELSDLIISVHIHSAAPSSRLIIINNRIYREGESVDSQLKLEEITPDGVIMSIRDNLFWRYVR